MKICLKEWKEFILPDCTFWYNSNTRQLPPWFNMVPTHKSVLEVLVFSQNIWSMNACLWMDENHYMRRSHRLLKKEPEGSGKGPSSREPRNRGSVTEPGSWVPFPQILRLPEEPSSLKCVLSWPYLVNFQCINLVYSMNCLIFSLFLLVYLFI